MSTGSCRPWKHKLIDDFLPADVFTKLAALPIKKIADHELKRYDHVITNDQVIRNDLLDKEVIERIHQTYHHRMMQWLEEMAPETVELVGSSNFCVTIMGRNTLKRIHRDTPKKLLNALVYVAPEKNNATVLYNTEDGADANPLEWKQNRALVWANGKDTWHSYKTDGISNRLTVVYALNRHP